MNARGRLWIPLGLFALAIGRTPVLAQCLDWTRTFENPGGGGLAGNVAAFAVYDDGSGPTLYAGGTFTKTTAGVAANNIARWNGSTWTPVAGGISGSVFALAVFDDGSGPALYAGGEFASAGGTAALNIARWNGSTWSSVGGGLNGGVHDLVVYDPGSGLALCAGGSFSSSGATPVANLARWNGSSWSALGNGTNGLVSSLCLFDDGSGSVLCAGGLFTSAGGAPASRIARWNGSTWSAFGAGLNDSVEALAVFDDGGGSKLYAGGAFTRSGPLLVDHLVRWDGASWSSVGGGGTGTIRALRVSSVAGMPALYVCGQSVMPGSGDAVWIARWDGASWSTLGEGTDWEVLALAEHDDGTGNALYAGGQFMLAGGNPAGHVARWNVSGWSSLESTHGTGLSNIALAALAFDDGSGPALFVGGQFEIAGEVVANGIAKWDGQSWSALGTPTPGLSGTSAFVWALRAFDDGSGPALYAGGGFTSAGGVVASNIARWNGSIWSALGSGVSGSVRAMCVFDDGSGPALYAGGFFDSPASNVAKWDGTSWTALAGGVNSQVNALAVFDDGSGPAMYAGGYFTSAGGHPAESVARWDGSTWTGLNSGISGGTEALVVHDDGTGTALYAASDFDIPGFGTRRGVFRWTGAAWSFVGGSFPGTPPTCLTVFDDGAGPALYAGGIFTSSGGVGTNGIAKWNGSSWSALGSGTAQPVGVAGMAAFDDGIDGGADLYAVGQFKVAGGVPSLRIASWRGCAGPASLFCFGDGSERACPCKNTGAPKHGCENSSGTGGALLHAGGATQPDTVVLTATGEKPTALTIFLQGTTTISPVVFGDGLRCVHGVLKRLYAKNAIAGKVTAPALGDLSITARSAQLNHPILPGETRYYMTYYRDSSPSFCPSPNGATFNGSNAVSIRW